MGCCAVVSCFRVAEGATTGGGKPAAAAAAAAAKMASPRGASFVTEVEGVTVSVLTGVVTVDEEDEQNVVLQVGSAGIDWVVSSGIGVETVVLVSAAASVAVELLDARPNNRLPKKVKYRTGVRDVGLGCKQEGEQEHEEPEVQVEVAESE